LSTSHVAHPLDNLGDVLRAKGDVAGALVYYRHAVEIREQTLGPEHPQTLPSVLSVAAALAELRRCDEARPLLARVTVGLERTLGAESVLQAKALASQAECDLAGGQIAEGLARLERAVAMYEKSGAERTDRGAVRWRLARALWSRGRREEAVAAAQKAAQELGGDADGAHDLAAVRAWLARQTPSSGRDTSATR
jgi:tetratricopeptide (TPR) repeat protein